MEVTYSLETDDLVAVAHYQCQRRRSNPTKAGRVFWYLFLPAFLCALVLVSSADFLPVAFVFFVFLLLYFVWQKWYVNQTYQAYYSEENARGILGKHHLCLLADSFTETTDFKEVRCQWKVVEDVVLTPQHVLICLNKLQAFVVPRRAFEKEEDYQKFVQELQAHAKAGKGPGYFDQCLRKISRWSTRLV